MQLNTVAYDLCSCRVTCLDRHDYTPQCRPFFDERSRDDVPAEPGRCAARRRGPWCRPRPRGSPCGRPLARPAESPQPPERDGASRRWPCGWRPHLPVRRHVAGWMFSTKDSRHAPVLNHSQLKSILSSAGSPELSCAALLAAVLLYIGIQAPHGWLYKTATYPGPNPQPISKP